MADARPGENANRHDVAGGAHRYALEGQIRSLGDIDLDGLPDLLWQNDVDGSIAAWTMRMLTASGGFILAPGWADPAWKMIRVSLASGNLEGDSGRRRVT